MTRPTHLYLVTCKDTGLRYCGITSKSVKTRWSIHVWTALRTTVTTKFGLAIARYGPDSFVVERLWTYDTQEEAAHAEVSLIAHLGLFHNGLNGSFGGESTIHMQRGPSTQATKEKRKAAARRRANDPAWIEKMRQVAQERAKNPEYRKKLSESSKGKSVSQEIRERISAKLTGRKLGPRTEEVKRKISEAHKGRRLSPESIAKMAATQRIRLSDPAARERISVSLRGRKQPPRSAEWCAKISEHKKAYWAARRERLACLPS